MGSEMCIRDRTKAALQSVLHNVTDMEQLVQVQILAQNIIDFSNAMTSGLEAVLDNKLSPSLVPENLLQQDFRAFREHVAAQGLTPVIQDHKQVYQLTARHSFRDVQGSVKLTYAASNIHGHRIHPLHASRQSTSRMRWPSSSDARSLLKQRSSPWRDQASSP